MLSITYDRQCFTCGDNLTYFEFRTAFSRGDDVFINLIDEIWENPIFVIECCKCYKFRLIAEEHAKRLAKRPYKCGLCNHRIENLNLLGLCYTCYFEEKKISE